MKNKQLWLGGTIYWLALLGLAIWSYSQTDPNLTWIINAEWFRHFQQQIWSWGADRERLQLVYTFLIAASFLGYGLIVRSIRNFSWPKVLVLFLLIASPLLFAYNALSHDVFNYMFNAKMIWYYHANPHQQVALDFPQDDWLRFMHNTHTPAPYAYGWTIFSVPFGWLGMGKFLPTWLIFRILAVVSWLLMAWIIYWYQQQAKQQFLASRLAIFMLNPLVLIEVIMNMHNDLWMMAPAMFALVLFTRGQRKLGQHLLGWILVLAAAAVKYANLIWAPLYLLVSGLSLGIGKFNRRLAEISGSTVLKLLPVPAILLMFILLLLPRSQQFHPWYLTWVLVWLPMLFSLNWPLFDRVYRYFAWLLIVFSATSLLRYLPWLATGGFSDVILLEQQRITWSAIPISLLVWLLVRQTGVKENEA